MSQITYHYLPPETLDSLKHLEMVAKYLAEGGRLGLHRSPYHGFSSEFAEYRKYSPGDSIRHLDWKAYARSDRYYIRRYEEDTNLKSFIILDQSASMGMPDPDNHSKFNCCCYFAAAFMYLMYSQHDACGLFTYDRQPRDAMPCRCSRQHLSAMLKRLEQLSPEGDSDAATALSAIAGTIPGRSLVIIFSDFFDPKADFLKALHHLTFKKCEVILFQCLNKLELEFPYKGLIEFEDIENGSRIELESSACREPYLRELKKYNNSLKDFCNARKIILEPICSATPFERILAAYFSKREGLN